MDKRAGEYVIKARNTDRNYCGVPEGTIGPVENKLISMGLVKGVVFGAFGECSQPVHDLIQQLAISRVQVAGPQKGRRGIARSEKAEISLKVAFLRRSLSITAVKTQSFSLLSRLELLGPGMSAAAKRRSQAVYMERR